MSERNSIRIPSINHRGHQEVLYQIFQVLENDEGAVSDKDGTVINISFMTLLKNLDYDSGDEACTLGATYRQLYKIGQLQIPQVIFFHPSPIRTKCSEQLIFVPECGT